MRGSDFRSLKDFGSLGANRAQDDRIIRSDDFNAWCDLGPCIPTPGLKPRADIQNHLKDGWELGKAGFITRFNGFHVPDGVSTPAVRRKLFNSHLTF